MVAGDHHRSDPGPPAGVDGVGRVEPGRVGDGNQPDESQVGLGRLWRMGDTVDPALREGEHPEALGGPPVRRDLGRGRHVCVGGIEEGRHRSQGALGRHPGPFCLGVDGRHAPPDRVEADLGPPGAAPGQLRLVDAELAGEGEERPFGRISDGRPGPGRIERRTQAGVVARRRHPASVEQEPIRRRIGPVPLGRLHDHVAVGRIASPGHPVAGDRSPNPLDDHPVLGQGAGLVRADHRDRAE